jgi:hypothetical protein
VAVAAFGERYAELEAPIPFAPAAGQITAALEGARPSIYAYDLSPVGRPDRTEPPGALPAGPYTLRPRLQDGNRFTLVFGPIVELSA